MNDCGFLYIATGRRFVDEAAVSYASLRRHMPDVPVCCFTDEPEYAAQTFAHVERIEHPFRNFLEKIPPLWRTPYARTVFVDTDTVFAAPVTDLFTLLERFDLAAAPDPFWVEAPGCPPCFQHLNTGLIAYRKTERVEAFLRRWFEQFQAGLAADPKNPIHWHDQVVFQRELYASDLRLYVLPGEYNLRVACPQLIRIWAKARMLHARHGDLGDLGLRLNAESEYRVVLPNWTFVRRTELHLIGRRSDRVLRAWHGVLRRALAVGGWLRRRVRGH
jgi:hypothetical protein